MSTQVATIVLPSGQQQRVTPTFDLMGNINGYDVMAVTPTGENKLLHSKVGEEVFKEKVAGGIMGNFQHLIGTDEASIMKKYESSNPAANPQAALQRDREIYQLRQNNIQKMSANPEGLLFDPATGQLSRLTPQVAAGLLNQNTAWAASKGVFGIPVENGLYMDPANPTAPPTPLPYIQVNPTANAGYGNPAGVRNAYGKDNIGPNMTRVDASPFAGAASNQNKNTGRSRLFGIAPGGFSDQAMQPQNPALVNNTPTPLPQSMTEGYMRDVLHSQALSQGASFNPSVEDPFYLSYAYRRERPELNQDIVMQEQCQYSPEELFNLYKSKELADGMFRVVNSSSTAMMGTILDIESQSMRKMYFAKQLKPKAWGDQQIEIVRRMISTGPHTQTFDGFAIDPQSNSLIAVFARPNIQLPDYIRGQPMSEERFKLIFATILRALCHYESIGIHHPDLSNKAIYFGTQDPSSLKLTNPFVYDSIYQEVSTVYLNKYNTLHGRAAFNKRYLQENVMELFIILLATALGTDFNMYSPRVGEFNGQEILRAIDQMRRTTAPSIAELIARYLVMPLDKLPTPILLANNEGVPIEYNSYYGHSRMNSVFYYPFEPFLAGNKKIFQQNKAPAPVKSRIPHYSEIDVFNNGDNLEFSRMIGTSHRKKNFVIDSGARGDPLRPYYLHIDDLKDDEDLLMNRNPMLGSKGPNMGNGLRSSSMSQNMMMPLQTQSPRSQMPPQQPTFQPPIPIMPPVSPPSPIMPPQQALSGTTNPLRRSGGLLPYDPFNQANPGTSNYYSYGSPSIPPLQPMSPRQALPNQFQPMMPPPAPGAFAQGASRVSSSVPTSSTLSGFTPPSRTAL